MFFISAVSGKAKSDIIVDIPSSRIISLHSVEESTGSLASVAFFCDIVIAVKSVLASCMQIYSVQLLFWGGYKIPLRLSSKKCLQQMRFPRLWKIRPSISPYSKDSFFFTSGKSFSRLIVSLVPLRTRQIDNLYFETISIKAIHELVGSFAINLSQRYLQMRNCEHKFLSIYKVMFSKITSGCRRCLKTKFIKIN